MTDKNSLSEGAEQFASFEYTSDIGAVNEDMLADGFFVGWPNPPSCATHLKILQNSYVAYVAIDMATDKVVGFINAISDGVLSAYIPLLEVLPEYQGRGIGNRLVQLLLTDLGGLYMIDVLCDEDIQPFYVKFGGLCSQGVVFRNYDAQSGNII